MEFLIQGWLSVWLYVMAAIGIALSVLIYRNRKKWDGINIFCTLAVIVLVLHVIEEWVLPGGLHYSYNISHGSDILSTYPMNRLTDMITNFGGVILGCLVLKVWGFKKPAGIAVMLFSMFELVIHVVIGVNDMRTFSEYGMDILYSPGLITSIFGFLPVSVGLFRTLYKKGNMPTVRQHIMAITAIVVFCFLLINLPEMLLGDKNSPYIFTNRGYYEQYGEQYEAEQGVRYR